MSFIDKLLLASQSPRRRDLVRNLFKNIELLAPGTEEPRPKSGELYLDYLTHCVNKKWADARDLVATQDQDAMLLVADTIVVLKNEILGKPIDAKDAIRMLKKLSGKEHLVCTAFILDRANQRRPHPQVVETKVRFKVLSPQEIQAYVRSGEPMDKAGSYGFQGAALPFIQAVRGSYSNIVGLPLEALRERAEALGAHQEGDNSAPPETHHWLEGLELS